MPTDSRFNRLNTQASAQVQVWVEGEPVMARTGDSAAAVVLAAGLRPSRTTALSESPRAPYCMMGVCYECLLEIDGVENTQGCMTQVRDGMQIKRQQGSHQLKTTECCAHAE